ncbi:hypothetical protein KC347_g306 [Hortaea werneckii]|nr:hypothetical protein KC347_g306 [Hortaea werneckii]
MSPNARGKIPKHLLGLVATRRSGIGPSSPDTRSRRPASEVHRKTGGRRCRQRALPCVHDLHSVKAYKIVDGRKLRGFEMEPKSFFQERSDIGEVVETGFGMQGFPCLDRTSLKACGSSDTRTCSTRYKSSASDESSSSLEMLSGNAKLVLICMPDCGDIIGCFQRDVQVQINPIFAM